MNTKYTKMVNINEKKQQQQHTENNSEIRK